MTVSAPPPPALPGPDRVPGVAVSVLRKTLDLMETQGEAVVTMISTAPRVQDITSGKLVADPQLGRIVDVFA